MRRHVTVPLDEYLRTIGERVRTMRGRRGWDQATLALASGLTVSALSLLETGKRVPTLAVLYRVAQALGTDVGRLTRGSRKRMVSAHWADSRVYVPCGLPHEEER